MKRVLISLDELLDTRLGCVSHYFPQLVESWLKEVNHDYFLRQSDQFIWESMHVSREKWLELYDLRDVRTLQNSVVTHIPSIVSEMLLEYQRSGEEALIDSWCEVDINIYPYQLSEEEKEEMLVFFQEELFPVARSVHLVEYRMEELNGDFVKQRYHLVAMYDFNRWLDIHGKKLNEMKVIFSETTFLAPRLFLEDPTKLENEPNPARRKEIMDIVRLDPFKMLESALSVKMQLRFVPASDFGPVLRKPYRKKSTEPDLVDLSAKLDSRIGQDSPIDPLYQFLQEQGSSAQSEKDQGQPE